MSRSPLAYPLTRGIDSDSGGAADLQTDIMRFMAILALCLVAIFALVQSLPMAPQTPAVEIPVATSPTAAPKTVAQSTVQRPTASPPLKTSVPEAPVPLTRPAWTPKYAPAPPPATTVLRRTSAATVTAAATQQAPAAESTPEPAAEPPATAAPSDEQDGFTLRFESDLALTRLVAGGQVGFYAIEDGRAQRMSVHNSRISFWAASTPNEFHEMETATVPQPVVEALRRSGADATTVKFGVTLPPRLRRQLAQLMHDHRGGELVIGGDGNLQLETGG